MCIGKDLLYVQRVDVGAHYCMAHSNFCYYGHVKGKEPRCVSELRPDTVREYSVEERLRLHSRRRFVDRSPEQKGTTDVEVHLYN